MRETTMTRQEFSKLTDKEAAAYLLAEIRSIASDEARANRELEATVDGVLLPKIATRMAEIFEKAIKADKK
jgi:hypothetical protein